MEVLPIFSSRDQETDSWFKNHEPLIPTLMSEKPVIVLQNLPRFSGISWKPWWPTS